MNPDCVAFGRSGSTYTLYSRPKEAEGDGTPRPVQSGAIGLVPFVFKEGGQSLIIVSCLFCQATCSCITSGTNVACSTSLTL